MLSPRAVEEFKKLYESNYGIKLSDEEASFHANNLISFYATVYKNPDQKNDQKNS
jgi:hypothetical protein